MRNDLDEVMNPDSPGQQDDFTKKMRDELGYVGAKRLPDGTYVGLIPLMFTLAICMGVTRYSAYARRYCYEDGALCLEAYREIIDGSHIPEGWIAKRPA